jgi:hypothetical protein
MNDIASKKPEARKIEKQGEIAAPVEAVWKMLTAGAMVSAGDAGGAWRGWEHSTNYGWAFMLTNLRHCMECHAGQARWLHGHG